MKDLLKKLDDVSRRDFAAYLAKACLGVGLLPWLPGTSAYAASPVLPASARASAKNVIYLYMGGGMSHLDTFDTKPGSASQGPTEAIKTSISGYSVSSNLQKLSKLMKHVAVVNSMRTTTGAHEEGRYFMRTSYAKRGTIIHPALGSWMLALTGRTNQILPGSVSIGGGSSDATAGFLENKFAPLPLDSATSGLPYSKREVTEAEFTERLTLADALDKPFRARYKQKQVRAYTDLYADAITLMNSKDLEVFDITKETEAVRKEYGNNGFGQGCLLARRLVEQNVRCVEVNLGGWDTHSDNFQSMDDRVPQLDQAMATLLEDLRTRGMLQSTLVVLATEFGRTPLINSNRGRDHHPRAFSCVLAGGGIKGGQIYGKTDASGAEVAENPVSIPDFNATIGMALGLKLNQVMTSPSGRPFVFADHGQPIKELF